MGPLVEGQWRDAWYDTASTRRRFVRCLCSVPLSPGLPPGTGFLPPETAAPKRA